MHFGYWTYITLSVGITFAVEIFILGREWKPDRGWSYIERSERTYIRNRSGVGRTERGSVSRKDGCRSGRAGFERRCIRDTARIQRGLIWDRYTLQSERVIFYPIIPDQAIIIGRHWSGGSSAVWCECTIRFNSIFLFGDFQYPSVLIFYLL